MAFDESLLVPEEVEAPSGFDESLLVPEDPKVAKISSLRDELILTRGERSNADTRLGVLSDYVVGPVANIFNTAANLPFLASRAIGLVPPEQEPPMAPGESFVAPELLSAPAETVLERLGYISPESSGPSVARGVIRGGSHLVSGLATPENIPFLGVGAVRPALQAATGAGFSALMASQIPEATEQLAESTVTGTPQDIAESATTLAGLFAMTGAPVVLPPALQAIRDRRVQRAENKSFDRASTEVAQDEALQFSDPRYGREQAPFVPEGIRPSETGIGTETTTSKTSTEVTVLEPDLTGAPIEIEVQTNKGPRMASVRGEGQDGNITIKKIKLRDPNTGSYEDLYAPEGKTFETWKEAQEAGLQLIRESFPDRVSKQPEQLSAPLDLDVFEAKLEAEAVRAQEGLDAGTRTTKDAIPAEAAKPPELMTADEAQAEWRKIIASGNTIIPRSWQTWQQGQMVRALQEKRPIAAPLGESLVRGIYGEGYVREGDKYVFHDKPNPTEPATPKAASLEFAYDGMGGESWHVLEDIPGHPKGSTVTRSALEKEGFTVPKRPEVVGMGAMQQGELTPKPRPATGNKFAILDAERAERGQAPMEPVMKQSWGSALDEAMERIEADPHWQDRLVEELLTRPRAASPVEIAALNHRKVDLRNELEKSMREGVQSADDGRFEDAALAEVRSSEWSDRLTKLEEATGRGGAGTEAGRSLAAQKMMMKEDFTLAAMELKKRSENGFRQLTSDERAELVKLHNEIEATRKAADEAAAAAEIRIVTAEAAKALAEMERDVARKPLFHPRILAQAERIAQGFETRADAARIRLREKLARTSAGVDPTILIEVAEIGAGHLARAVVDIGRWTELMIRDFGEDVRPYLQAGWEAANKLFEEGTSQVAPKVKAAIRRTADAATTKTATVEAIKEKLDAGDTAGITSLVQKLARALVESGVRGREALIDAVHAELLTIDPSLTRRDTMDAISGYGKFKQLTKDEVSVALRDLKGQMQQVAKLEDLEARKPPLKTGVERRVPSEEERRLIKAVNELKRKYGIATTDAATQLKSSLDSRKTYYRNQITDLERQIDSRTKDAPSSAAPTDAELVGLKERRAQLKKEFDEIFDPALTPEQQEAKALEVEARALRKRITEQERMLATGELVVPGRPVNRPAHPALEALKQERDALNVKIAEARKKPESQREAEALASKVAALEKRIAAAEAKVASGDISPTARPVNRPSIPAIEQAKQRLEAINAQLAELRKAARPPVDLDARGLAALKARLARSTADLEARLKAGDFAKREPRRVVLDAEAIRAKLANEDARSRFNKGLQEDAIRRLSTGKKIWRGIKRTVGIPIHLVSSFDFSAPRQLLFAILSNTTRIVTHPHRTGDLMVRPFLRMFTGAWSESHAKVLESRRSSRPNSESGADKVMRLELTSLDETKFTPREERAHSILDEWAALPFKTGNHAKTISTSPFKVLARGVRFSNRAFVTALNEVRVSLADELLRVNYKDRPPTDVDLQIVGNLVNVATGRGKLNPTAAKVGSWFLWSPKLLASRVQTLTGQPLLAGQWAGSFRARKIVAKEYARMLIAGYALYRVSRLFSDDEDANITSSDAGKIVRGNTRIDLWGGYQQVTVIGARVGTATTTSLRGRESSLGPDREFGGRGIWYVLSDFGRGKLRPEVAAVVDIFTRETGPNRIPTTPATVAESLLVPLPMRDIKGIMAEHGFTEAMILQILSEFGAGVSNYEDVERQR